jgi:hypothetical protein
MPVGRSIRAVGAASVLAVAAVSMLLTMQGWQSRVPAFDLLTYDYTARAFLETGAIPSHGDTGSYGSLAPPGTAWLMMPGIVLLGDPRLSDYVGTGLLHVAALAAIFILGTRHFGRAVGIAGTVLYGLSAHGLFLAGSLWPNGRPDFFVVFVLLVDTWVDRRDARILAAALAVLALGLYVDLALAPAVFVVPVVWVLHRPPVSVRSLLVAAAIVGVAWSPYLLLQVERGFADLRSQLLLQDIVPADYRSAWCDPERQISDVLGPPVSEDASVESAGRVGGAIAVVTGLAAQASSNFDTAVLALPALGALLGLATAATVLTYSTRGAGATSLARQPTRRSSVIGIVLAGAGLILHELAIAGAAIPGIVDPGSVRKAGLALAISGAAIAVLPWLAWAADRVFARAGITIQTPARAAARRVLVLSLVVPWLIVVIVAEPGKPERFWWLWPLQVLFLAALAFDLLPRLAPRWIASLVAVALAAFILVNPMTVQRLDSWARTGWAGNDAPEVQVVDAIGSVAAASGRDRVAVGYETFVYWFMAAYHITDPTYKVGAEFDLLLADRHGVVNTNACAEGLSPADEFRVVQTRRKPGVGEPSEYFEAARPPGFVRIGTFDRFELWVRGGRPGPQRTARRLRAIIERAPPRSQPALAR